MNEIEGLSRHPSGLLLKGYGIFSDLIFVKATSIVPACLKRVIAGLYKILQ